MKKLFVIFVLIFAYALNAEDTQTDNSNTEETAYEVIEIEDIKDELPNLNISTSFRYSLNGKEFKEMAGKFRIDSSLYYMVSIKAIMPEEYDNSYIDAKIDIPADDSLYNVKFYQGTLLSNNNTNFYVSIRTSHNSAVYQNNFIFKIEASKPCLIPVKVEYKEPYTKNNSISTIEFREKKFGIF